MEPEITVEHKDVAEENPELAYGKIAIIGPLRAKVEQIYGFCKAKKISKDRIEIISDYNILKGRGIGKFQYNDHYRLILAGPMPHSMEGTAGYSSALARMEQEEGFPKVVRLGENQLKITLSGIKKAVNEQLECGYIRA